MTSLGTRQLLSPDDWKQLLAEKSDKLLRRSQRGFFEGLDEINAILARYDPAPSPLFHAIDQKAKDYGTYFFAAYSDSRDLDRSIIVYKTVKSLVRCALLLDRYFEVGNQRYMKIANGLAKSINRIHVTGHLSYSMNYSIKQLWPFWDFEQSVRQRMAKNYPFTYKEVRRWNLSKSSDAPVLYASVLDNELPNFNQNVASIIHYNQALQDVQDDFADMEQDLDESLPNVFIMAATRTVSFSKLARNPGRARKTVMESGAPEMIMDLVNEYGDMTSKIMLPASYVFLKYLSVHYVEDLKKAFSSPSAGRFQKQKENRPVKKSG